MSRSTGSSPTARTLKLLRADGWEAAVVEKWIAQARQRVDLFGCIDVLAVRAGEPVLAVQATTASNVAARVKKAMNEPRLRTWLAAGQRFEVWGWAKRGERGRPKRWVVTRRVLTSADLIGTGDTGTGAKPSATALGITVTIASGEEQEQA